MAENEPQSKPSEFAQSLRDGGIEFDSVAQTQHEKFKASRREAAAWAIAGLTFLATTAGVYVQRDHTRHYEPILITEAAAGYGSFLISGRRLKQARLLKLERQNSLYLSSLVNSAPETTNPDEQ
jgi:hypothetical protein